MQVGVTRQEANKDLSEDFMDVVIEDKQIAGVRQEDIEDRERWRRMIHCGNS